MIDSGVPSNRCDSSLVAELMALQADVARIHQALLALSPLRFPGRHLPEAKGELGAVVQTTEQAANKILDACQVFEEVAASHIEKIRLAAAVSTIYEACSFQDLTGQRIAKVQRLIGSLEEAITSLLERLKIEQGVPSDMDSAADPFDDNALLNGPAMPGHGVDQADIDAMFD